jgi:hypothetical protein
MVGRISKKEMKGICTAGEKEGRRETEHHVSQAILLMSDPARMYQDVWQTRFTAYEISELVAVVTLRRLGGHWDGLVSGFRSQGDDERYIDFVEQSIM